MPGTDRSYDHLDAGKTVKTVDVLSRRIAERFPGSGLHAVSRHLSGLAAVAGDRAASIARPIWWLRVLATVFVGAVLMVSVVAVVQWQPTGEPLTWTELIQVLEAGINDVVLIGLGVFFLFTIGIRIRRRRALRALHELRAVAHIIDMHQLTKDPERLRKAYTPTVASPPPNMDRFLLGRYLDYCSELLSLCGKVAAIYAQAFDDGVVIAAASDIETLCTGLSRKIWQKINVLETLPPDPPRG